MDMGHIADQIKASLQHDCTVLDLLLAVLDQEQIQLKANNADNVAALAVNKESYFNQLEQGHHHRSQIMRNVTLENTQTGLAQLMSQLSSGKNELNNQLSTYTQKLATAKQMHQINGTVISVNLHTMQRLQTILQGKSGQVATYGSKGEIQTQQQQSGGTSA